MKLSPSRAVWICGLLMSLTSFSIDITLPLFSVMAADLGAPIERIPLSVTFYMISMGFGQFVFGCFSDRFGRRRLLIIGMCLFVAGALLSAFAQTLTTLVVARAIQGFGTAAPHIISRAIIRDLYQGTELAQKMAVATGIFSVGPILAPLFGAAVLEVGGNWRWVFLIMALFCTALLLTLKLVPETNKNHNPTAITFASLLNNAKTVLGNQQSRYFIVVSAVIAVSLLLIISTIPSIYSNTFNITGGAFALYYAVQGTGIILGQIANHRLIGQVGIVPSSIIATSVMLLSALSISVCAWIGYLTPWGVSLLLTVFALGYLGVVANATSLLLSAHGDIVGFTAAFQGTVTMLFSGLLSSVLSLFIQDNIALWGLVIAAGPFIVLLILIRWQKIQTQ